MQPTRTFPFVHERRIGRPVAGLLLIVFGLIAGLISTANAAAPSVDDRAGLFSETAVAQANQAIQRIYQNTTPHKQVFVETRPSLPEGKQADALSAERFRQLNTDGLVILMVKSPHKLAVTVGRDTQDRFHDAEAVRSAMLERFRRDDYDGGLLAGLRIAETGLLRGFAPGAGAAATSHRTREVEPERSGGFSYLWLLLLGGAGLLAFLFWRTRNRASSFGGYGRGAYGPMQSGIPGAGNAMMYGGGGGGGLGRSILGGAAGALAGNWLYDRFFNGSHDGSAQADSGTRGDSFESDHGEVGSTFGGSGGGDDWGGGGGGDGGGGGGDW